MGTQGVSQNDSKQHGFRIPVWNGIFEHCRRMREAIWLFLYFIDKTTKEFNSGEGGRTGSVLGGMPCRDQDAARVLGRSERTIREWRNKLADLGYITQKRAPFGSIITLPKSKKWQKRPEDSFPSDRQNSSDQIGRFRQSDRQIPSVRPEEPVDPIKTIQLTLQKDSPPNPLKGECGGVHFTDDNEMQSSKSDGNHPPRGVWPSDFTGDMLKYNLRWKEECASLPPEKDIPAAFQDLWKAVTDAKSRVEQWAPWIDADTRDKRHAYNCWADINPGPALHKEMLRLLKICLRPRRLQAVIAFPADPDKWEEWQTWDLYTWLWFNFHENEPQPVSKGPNQTPEKEYHRAETTQQKNPAIREGRAIPPQDRTDESKQGTGGHRRGSAPPVGA